MRIVLEKINSKFIINLLMVFMLLQPLYDIFVYFLDLNGITTIITSLIRPLFAGILFIILLLHKDNLKKEKLLFIIILILTVIFSGLHLVNISDYFYSKSAGSLFNEVRILLTCFYFLLMFINLFIIFKITSKKEKQLILKCLVLVGVLISILYFCSIIFKTSQLTYGIGTTKGGFKGWSMSSHYVGHSLLLLMPIVYYVCIIKKLFSSKILNYIIPIFVIIPGFYLVGTKSPTYSLLLLTSIFFILEVLNAIICKKVRSSLFYSLFLTLLLFITLPSTHAYNNMQIQIENSKGDVGNVDFVPKPPTNNVILPEVKYENEFDKRLSSVLKGENLIGDNVFDNREIQLKINLNLRKISPTKDKILGYGYNNMERNTWVETESVSLYFSFGIVLFILIIVFPYLFVGLIGLMNLFKDKKTFTLKLFAAASVFMSLFIISVVGYTLYFAQTNFYLAILLIVIYSIFNEKKGEFKKNINIEEDIEMDNTLMLQKGKKYLFMISDMNIGGAEVGLVDVLNELSIDNTVDLVLLRKRGPLLARLSPKINVFGILKDSRSKFLNEIVRYLYFAGGIFTKFVYSLTIKEKYDVEVAYLEGYPAVFISNSTNKESIKIASIRVGLKNHQLTIEKFAYGRHLLKNAYKKVDKIHCVSELTKNEFDEKFPKFKYKTKCIFTYFNIESIKKRSNEKIDFSYNLKAFNFLAVGRFDEQKGYDQLVYAFKSLLDKKANVYLHILGKNDTEYGIKIKEIIKKLGIDVNIILHGVVENPYPYIKECDAFISSSHYEGFPRVINEALALGKLCIGTNVTGTKEALLDGKRGILIDDNIDGIKEGMLLALKDKDILSKYKKSISEYDGNKITFFKEFDELCQKKESMIIFFPKLSYGGMEKALINLINFAKLDSLYDLTLLLVYNTGEEYLKLLPDDMKVIILNKGKWNIVGKCIAGLKLLLCFIKYSFKKYDISISYSHQHASLAYLTRLASKNNICFIHSNIKNSRTEKELKKLLRDLKYQKFNKLICVSEDGKIILQKLINRNDVNNVNNLIDGNKILTLAKEPVVDFNFNKNIVTFINVSRHDESSKKLNRIINATKRLNEDGYKFNVLFVGDGDATDSYKELKSKYKLDNLFIIGSRSNPYKYYKNSSAVLLSSIAEGYPIVFIESMILGVPIVTTDVSDALKDVDGKYGIVVPNNDTSIYDGMKKFLDEGFKNKEKFDYIKYNRDIEKSLIKIFEEK